MENVTRVNRNFLKYLAKRLQQFIFCHSLQQKIRREEELLKFWRVPFDYKDTEITKGVVHIIEERCKGCGYCIAHCPRDILEESEAYNSKGYHPPVVKADECLNCHYCELLCPEFAIFSIAASE